MRYLVSLLLLATLISCGKQETVQLDDNGSGVRSNTARIELLEANDLIQDLRLNALEGSLVSLEDRVTVNEDNIDSNSEDISELFDYVMYLEEDLDQLRSDFRREVRSLRRADRQTRRLIRRKVSQLRRRLSREIRARRLADADLQNQIDDVSSDLNSLEARVYLDEQIGVMAFMYLSMEIGSLEARIQADLNALDSRLTIVEGDIQSINSSIANIGNVMSDLQDDIDDVRSKLTSVVYPCGEGNSDEVLLQTQDGLVAYFQSSSNKTISFNDNITVQGFSIPSHYDRYASSVRHHWFHVDINYSYNYVAGLTVPTRTYSVGDSTSVRTIDRAYLKVLENGHFGTTDGNSCHFDIINGEIQTNGGPQ